MNDRELLELAAKAIHLPENYENAAFMLGFYSNWNPLTDDGDALRLAVRLQIDVKHYGDHVVAWFDGGLIGTGRIAYDGDPYGATRLAIARAAAEIGRGMP